MMKDKIEKSNQNVYLDIARDLRQKIVSKEYLPQDKLPTENMLMQRYQASRATVRKALEVLEQQGYVVKRQGVGCMVAVPSLSKFSLEFDLSKYTARFNHTTVEYCNNKKILTELKVAPNSPLIKMQRALYEGNIPVIYDIKYFPFKKGVPFIEEEINYAEYGAHQGSNVSPFALECKLEITPGVIHDEDIARILCYKKEDPVLICYRTFTDREGAIYSFQITYMRKNLPPVIAYAGYEDA